jgi:hypothetical protein
MSGVIAKMPGSAARSWICSPVSSAATAPIEENAPFSESPVAGAVVIVCSTPASTVVTGCDGVPCTMTR